MAGASLESQLVPVDDAATLVDMIEVKEQRIQSWSRLAGGLGDEDGALAAAVMAARTGLGPMQKIAGLPLEQQRRVLETLRGKGVHAR